MLKFQNLSTPKSRKYLSSIIMNRLLKHRGSGFSLTFIKAHYDRLEKLGMKRLQVVGEGKDILYDKYTKSLAKIVNTIGTEEEDSIQTDQIFLTYLRTSWQCYRGKSAAHTDKIGQGLLNSILSLYVSTPVEDLPTKGVGYFLGRRNIPAAGIKKVLKEGGFTLETEDPSKADFFIVGDILTLEDNKLNEDLLKPIIMEYNLNRYYLSNYKKKDVPKPNLHVLNTLISNSGAKEKELNMLSLLLSRSNPSDIPESYSIRLLLFYLNIKGDRFNYKDKKHKSLIKNLIGVVPPYLKFLLEPKFLNTDGRLQYSEGELFSSYCIKAQCEDTNLLGKLVLRLWGRIYYLPMAEESFDVVLDHLDSVNYCIDNYNYIFPMSIRSTVKLAELGRPKKYPREGEFTTQASTTRWGSRRKQYLCYSSYLFGCRVSYKIALNLDSEGTPLRVEELETTLPKVEVSNLWSSWGKKVVGARDYRSGVGYVQKGLDELSEKYSKTDLARFLENEDFEAFLPIEKAFKRKVIKDLEEVQGDLFYKILDKEYDIEIS